MSREQIVNYLKAKRDRLNAEKPTNQPPPASAYQSKVDYKSAIEGYEEPKQIGKIRAKEKNSHVSKIAAKSNLFITVNLNNRVRLDKQTRLSYAQRLEQAMSDYGKELSQGHFLIPHKKNIRVFNPPPLRNERGYEFTIEIGSQRGTIHAHAIARFDGSCQIDTRVSKAFLKQKLQGVVGRNFHFDVKYYKNDEEILLAYVEKSRSVEQKNQEILSGKNDTIDIEQDVQQQSTNPDV
jgi:hypothetical protein